MFLRKAINLLKLIAVLTAVAIAILVRNHFEKPEVLNPEKIGIDPSVVKNAEVVEIKQGKDVIRLQKASDGWYVEGRPADSRRISDFLDSISSMSVEAYLGSVKGRERDYSLDALSRYEVSFKKGRKKITVYFGKAGPSFQSRYFRLSNSSSVYIGSGPFYDKLSIKTEDWREKRIFKVEGLREMEVETTSSAWSVRFSKNTAEIVADSRKVRLKKDEFEILKIDLESVLAESFIEGSGNLKAETFKKPEARVRLKYDGKTKSLAVVKKDSEYYLVKDDEFDWIYVVPRYNLDVLMENPLKRFTGEK